MSRRGAGLAAARQVTPDTPASPRIPIATYRLQFNRGFTFRAAHGIVDYLHRLGISDCYAASKLSEAEQAELLRLKLSGASRDAIEQAGRKKRAAAPTVKLSRIKAILPSGVMIVASGEGLTLDDLIESLGEAQREARKAREQGLDARTFQAVLRDKAKKG